MEATWGCIIALMAEREARKRGFQVPQVLEVKIIQDHFLGLGGVGGHRPERSKP